MANDVLIDIKPVHGEEINELAIIKAVQVELKAQTKEAERLFEKGYSTWKANHKPKWIVTQHVRGGDYLARMKTGDKPYLWIEGGTKTRKRWMSKDWKSKSKVKVLTSGSGGGKPGDFAGMGRRPLPIKEREHRVIVAAKMRHPFARDMGHAVNKGSKRFFSTRRKPSV